MAACAAPGAASIPIPTPAVATAITFARPLVSTFIVDPSIALHCGSMRAHEPVLQDSLRKAGHTSADLRVRLPVWAAGLTDAGLARRALTLVLAVLGRLRRAGEVFACI